MRRTPARPPLRALACLLALTACSRHPSSPVTLSDAELRTARCLGPVNATAFAVYLHGIDSPSLSDQELENRRVLARIATELGLRIALPRAGRRCAGQQDAECWSWDFSQADLTATEDTVRSAATECFGAGKPAGRIGFSKGGYMLTRQFRRCELREAPWVLTIGAAMLEGPLLEAPLPLQDCGSLVSLVGTEDSWNFDPGENYVRALQARGARARAVHYPGGHIIAHEPTRDALRELMATR